MFKIIFILLALLSISFAKSYSLFLASSKYLNVAKQYYEDVRFHTPDYYDVVIRVHEKQNYSVIIRSIENIEKAKSIQKLFFVQDKYKDSYIKRFNIVQNYPIVKLEKTKPLKRKEELYTQNIEDTNEYILASTMYNTGQYNKSYEMFYKLFLKDSYNININYFLAKSAFNIKKYDEATAAFERVLIQKPDFNQARFDFAKVLYILKINKEAKKEFETLLKADIKDKTKEEIKKYLNILNKKNKKIKGSANIMIGLSRSSNVNNGAGEYFLPIFNNIVPGEKPVTDNAHFEAVNLNFYNYFKSKPMRMKNSFLVYNKSYFEEKDENITVFSYKPSIEFLNKKNLYTFELAADKIRKRTDEDFYAFALSPKYKTKDYETFFRYQRIMYIKDSEEEKDFDRIQLYTKVNLFKDFEYFTNIYKNRRITDDRNDIDKYTIGNGFNYSYIINANNQLNLDYQFEYSKYKYENKGFRTKRRDKNHFVKLTLKHAIDKTSLINLSASYNKNFSNQDAYEYDDKEIILNYIKGYKW